MLRKEYMEAYLDTEKLEDFLSKYKESLMAIRNSFKSIPEGAVNVAPDENEPLYVKYSDGVITLFCSVVSRIRNSANSSMHISRQAAGL